jgi:RNA-directed DNA polymerase
MAVYPAGAWRRRLNLPQEICAAASESGLSESQGSLNVAQKSAEGIVGGATRRRPERLEVVSRSGHLVQKERQPIQLELAFAAGKAGEARQPTEGRAEDCTVAAGNKSPVVRGPTMEEVVERENLRKALKQVQRNKGAAGIDGMTVEQLGVHLVTYWPAIREALLQCSYQPMPVRRVEIPKPSGGGLRRLGIPTVLDRFIQQAVLQVLQPYLDPTFSERSYGFRPGRSAHQAVARAQQYVRVGYRWIVDFDLEKFFDRVNHDRLMAHLARRIPDRRMLKLIRSFLRAGVLEEGLVSAIDEGTPQGGPLSPLLSNVVLDELDRELERRGHCFVRYADDCNVYTRSRRAGQRVMASISRFIETRLRLKVNVAKSAVAQPWQRKFLGFSFTGPNTPQPRRRIAPQALARFRQRVRETTRRRRGVSIGQIVEELRVYLTGWRGYFGFCETPSELRDLDSWVRRRLRCVLWKQWKRHGARYRELVRRGVPRWVAQSVAASSRGPWLLSRSRAVSTALPNAFFRSLGLPELVKATAT